MKKFPWNCGECPLLHSYDLSVDDWTYVCLWSKTQIDDCDRYKSAECPLEKHDAQIRAEAIDEFVAYANTMPTIEDADGCIRPMSLEEMAEEMKKGKTCSDCIIDKTDACPRGAGRAVDDEICEEFLEEQSKGAGE